MPKRDVCLFRTPYCGPPERGEASLDFAGEVSRTKQEFRAECDINTIMSKYVDKGIAPVSVGVGKYGDFSGASDFLDAQLTIKAAEEQFAALPAKVRDRFKNEPMAFLEFVSNKDNYNEARELGLLIEESAPVVPKVEEPKAPDKK